MNAFASDMNDQPPRWADVLLQLVLSSADQESISGDLLEEYRDTIVPRRGRPAADHWYVRQVSGYVWRATWPWALAFGGAFLVRTGYDWRVPTTDFLTRSAMTTAVGATTLMSAGFWTSWRSGSVVAGAVIAAVTSQIAAVFSVVGVTSMLAVWHDADTMRAIAGSGGLLEVYTLPFTTIIPARVVGTIGGTLGSFTRRLR
jgi:hypothetical protein